MRTALTACCLATAFAGVAAAPSAAPPAGTAASTPAAATAPRAPLTDTALAALVSTRLQGDRSGACVAVAVVEDRHSASAYVCSDPKDQARIGPQTAFEIGSISKTFVAVLLADEIAAGRMRLDDPVARHLPPEVKVPSFKGAPITLRHLITHTSGLPSMPPRLLVRSARNPFSAMTEKQLFESLAAVTLKQAPGSEWSYSNFGSMVLSYVLARRSGRDFETAARERLFAPLGMAHSFVTVPPAGVRLTYGHLPLEKRDAVLAPHWDIPPDFAGMGGFRSTLPDMLRYLQANLGVLPPPAARSASEPAKARPRPDPAAILRAVARTHDETAKAGNVRMAMGWIIDPLFDRPMRMHEGHTGGFSSYLSFDAQQRRGVVVLADTSFASLGGLGDLAVPLLEARVAMGKPRVITEAPDALLDAMAGHYRFDNGVDMQLVRNGDRLEAHAQGQVFSMAYDSRGDFFLRELDAVVRPRPRAGGYSFAWMQGGGALFAKPMDAVRRVEPPLAPAALAEYTGDYPLPPDKSLRIFVVGPRLWGQTTGAGAFPLDRVMADVFFSGESGVEIRFERSEGKVVAMTLRHEGTDVRGERAPLP